MNYRVLFALVLNMNAATCFAEGTEWRRYQIPSTGANVDIPVSIFTEDAGSPEGGTGRRFFTQDHRADLTIQSVPNPGNDSPAEFLQKRRPPQDIQYKRVTPVSSLYPAFETTEPGTIAVIAPTDTCTAC